ncbi:MAG: restriction endonuclease subunit M [Proteobacteria bacterium]|nr:restriction endonuclease subunit M [Pseudomonadota bacterium]
MNRFAEKTSFIWSVSNILRGNFKAHQYASIILPFTVLRRLDQVLALTQEKVHETAILFKDKPQKIKHKRLLEASQCPFYNTSRFDFQGLLEHPDDILNNLQSYIAGFTQNVRDILSNFQFNERITALDKHKLLYIIVQKFNQINLDPYKRNPDGSIQEFQGVKIEHVTNLEMGYFYEDLIRRFAEQSNETSGEHFTPKEVTLLMVRLLFLNDIDILSKPGIERSIFDPCCGTGGMLCVAEKFLQEHNPKVQLNTYGQELNDGNYAMCAADRLIKGHSTDNIFQGSSLSNDQMTSKVDYLISNPPFGVDWSKDYKKVKTEHDTKQHTGRFGPGLPRKNDGSLLFVLHMISKMKPPDEGGSRLAVVLNASPLFSGAAGSGESNIRKYILENDLLEAIIALPTDMFYNTVIATYIWVLSNRKSTDRKNKVVLINGVNHHQNMRKSLGNKRKELSQEHIDELIELYTTMETGPNIKVFDNKDFGFQRITVEQPLRLTFQITDDALKKLTKQPAWNNLLKSKKNDETKKQKDLQKGLKIQKIVIQALNALDKDKVYDDRALFLSDFKANLPKDFKLQARVTQAVWKAIGVVSKEAQPCQDSQGNIEPNTSLRNNENVPLKESIEDYMKRKVTPKVPDAWVDASKTTIGYEIPFTKYFYVYQPPRSLKTIEKELKTLSQNIQTLMSELMS